MSEEDETCYGLGPLTMEWSFNFSEVDPETMRWFTGEEPKPTVERSMLLTYDKPMPLQTGKLGRKPRVEHARALRLARLKRRLARRENRPAGVLHCQVYLPRVWIEVADPLHEVPGA